MNAHGTPISALCRAFHNVPSHPPTPTDAHLAFLWHRIREQGLDRFLFYDGGVNSLARFRDIVTAESVWAYAGFSHTTGEPLALALLDRFLGRTAYLHFTFFKGEGFARHLEIGRAFMGLIFENGTLSCLMALTPAAFRHSWKFGLDLGFTRLGTIPGACGVLDRKTGELRYRDGVLMKLDNPKPQP